MSTRPKIRLSEFLDNNGCFLQHQLLYLISSKKFHFFHFKHVTQISWLSEEKKTKMDKLKRNWKGKNFFLTKELFLTFNKKREISQKNEACQNEFFILLARNKVSQCSSEFVKFNSLTHSY